MVDSIKTESRTRLTLPHEEELFFNFQKFKPVWSHPLLRYLGVLFTLTSERIESVDDERGRGAIVHEDRRTAHPHLQIIQR